MDLLYIAFRNITRNKRRTLLCTLSIIIGVGFIVMFLGFFRGMSNAMVNSMIDFETGHLQIMNSGYLEEQRRLPLDLNLESYNEIRDQLLNDNKIAENIKDITARIEFNLKLSVGSKSINMVGRGIEPEHEKKITQIANFIKDGKFLSKDEQYGILIGKPVADKLGVKVDDSVFIRSFDKYNSINILSTKIVGIFFLNYPIIDNHMIYTNIETAQELLGMDNEVSKLIVKYDSRKTEYEKKREEVEKKIGTKDISVYTWEKFADVIVSQTEGDRGILSIIFTVVMILILFGIINTMSMNVMERTREIGTVRAIGVNKKTLLTIFLFESIWMGVIGVIAGLTFAGIVASIFTFIGLDATSVMPPEFPIAFGANVYGDYRITDFVTGVLLGLGSTLIGGILPAFRASRVNVIECLRNING
ncbi:MAG: ABC transporter permease [Spirochaetales bacterium]|nr:ABC transporter permease [Spirochaetales bacterium]